MNKLLLILSFLFYQFTYAQETQIPVNEKTGTAEYTNVVNVSSAKANQLHDRALNWIKTFYPNPTGVLQTDDTTTFELTGKARFRLNFTDKKGTVTPVGYVAYSFTIQFKEGKYRYVIDRIHWQQSSYFDVSRWEKKDDPKYQEERWTQYVEQTVSYFNNMLDSLEEAMATAEEKQSTDW